MCKHLPCCPLNRKSSFPYTGCRAIPFNSKSHRLHEGEALGNDFDPGPGAGAQAAPLLEIIAENRWPVVCYPPHGGAMQVKEARAYLIRRAKGDADHGSDRRVCGHSAGEWGYHFHRLTSDRNWWKAVLGSSAPEVIEPFSFQPNSVDSIPNPLHGKPVIIS